MCVSSQVPRRRLICLSVLLLGFGSLEVAVLQRIRDNFDNDTNWRNFILACSAQETLSWSSLHHNYTQGHVL